MDAGSYRSRVRFFWIDAVLLDCVGDRLAFALALSGERLARRDDGEIAVHLEEMAQLRARIGAAEAVGAEHPVEALLRHERPDLVGKGLDVVVEYDLLAVLCFLTHRAKIQYARLV